LLPLKDTIGTDRLPLVTLLLIAANVAVWFLVQGGGIAHGPSDGQLVDSGSWPDVAGSIFAHGGLLHLVANMLFLWIFGTTVEDSMSRWRYLLFYLAGGLVAVVVQVAVASGSTVPTLGSSGALAAVIGGYVLLYRGARVLTIVLVPLLFTLVELPLWPLLALWVAEQALVGATSLGHVAGEGDAATWLAQAGGFLFGLLAIRLFADRRKQVPARVKVAA
jgi:membrane associated rhomboid family serine protease